MSIAAVLLTAAGLAAPAASVAGTIQSTNVEYDVTPRTVFESVREPVRLRFRLDSTYSDNTAPFTGKVTQAEYHLDPSFLISPQGFAQCDPASVENTTTTQAIAACGAADVGTGRADAIGTGAPLFGDIEIFNGTPASGLPRLVVHIRFTNGTTTVTTATIQPSSLPGYGQSIDLDVPILPAGYVFTDLDLAIRSGDYIAGRCPGRWIFDYGVTYDTGGGSAGSSNLPCTVTLRTPPAPPPPSNEFVVGPQGSTSQKGASLELTVPGPGTLALVGSPVPVAGKLASVAKKKKKKPKPQVLIAPAQATAVAAGNVTLPLTLTRAGLQNLVRKGKVVSGVTITFTPTGGTPKTSNATVTINGPKPKRKPKKK